MTFVELSKHLNPGMVWVAAVFEKGLEPGGLHLLINKKVPHGTPQILWYLSEKMIAKYQGASYGSSYDFSEIRTQHTKEKYGACNKSQSITILNLERVMCS